MTPSGYDGSLVWWPKTWLPSEGWRSCGLISMHFVPKATSRNGGLTLMGHGRLTGLQRAGVLLASSNRGGVVGPDELEHPSHAASTTAATAAATTASTAAGS